MPTQFSKTPTPVPIPLPPSAGLIDKLVTIVTSLTIQNVLTMALLAVIAAPSWFAYRFMQDEAFRREFMSDTKIVDMKVPCLVVVSNLNGQQRYGVSRTYRWEDRMEYLVSIVSPGLLSDNEVKDACAVVSEESRRIRLLPNQASITADLKAPAQP